MRIASLFSVVGVAVVLGGCVNPTPVGPPVVAPPIVSPVTSPASCSQVAVIGDSLTAASADALRAEISGVIVDGQGGRSTAQGADAARAVSADVDCWVFALGTNDLYASNDPAWGWGASIDAVLAVPDPSDRIWWVLPRAQDDAKFNEAGFVELLPASVQQVDPVAEFGPDGVHLTDAGYFERARLIGLALPQGDR